MYQIRSWENGEVVANVELNPYKFNMVKPNRQGIRRVLADAAERKQMNRTAGGETDPDDTSSPETYQDPSDDFLLGVISRGVQPGHTLVEVERENE